MKIFLAFLISLTVAVLGTAAFDPLAGYWTVGFNTTVVFAILGFASGGFKFKPEGGHRS